MSTELTLDALCAIQSGGTPRRDIPEYWDGDVPWVTITDMRSGLINATEERITKAGLDRSSAKLFPRGTLLLSIFATIGRTALLDLEAATNQAIAGLTIRDKSQVDANYLRRYLDFVAPSLASQARGVAQANINLSILRSTKVPLPPINEQRRLAAILDKADALRAKRRESIAKLDQLLQAVFLDMFGDPNSEQPAVDGSYELVSFTDLFADVSAGHIKTKQEAYLLAGRIPVVDQGQALIGGYTDDEAACSPIPLPVIVFGDHTRCVKLVDFPFGVGADGVKVLRPKLDDVPAFLYWWLRLRRIPSAGYSRHYKFLKEAMIRRPSVERQKQFAEFVSEVNKRMRTLIQASNRGEQLFLSLQSQAFSGAL